jgi:hypothetical protein
MILSMVIGISLDIEFLDGDGLSTICKTLQLLC